MNKWLIAVVLACSVSAKPVIADTSIEEASLVFNISDETQELAVLSSDEMETTEGALGPWSALGGGLIGGISNIGYQLGSNNDWNWGSFGYSVAGGALTGFSGGAAAWYTVPRVAFFGGFGAGSMGW